MYAIKNVKTNQFLRQDGGNFTLSKARIKGSFTLTTWPNIFEAGKALQRYGFVIRHRLTSIENHLVALEKTYMNQSAELQRAEEKFAKSIEDAKLKQPKVDKIVASIAKFKDTENIVLFKRMLYSKISQIDKIAVSSNAWAIQVNNLKSAQVCIKRDISRYKKYLETEQKRVQFLNDLDIVFLSEQHMSGKVEE